MMPGTVTVGWLAMATATLTVATSGHGPPTDATHHDTTRHPDVMYRCDYSGSPRPYVGALPPVYADGGTCLTHALVHATHHDTAKSPLLETILNSLETTMATYLPHGRNAVLLVDNSEVAEVRQHIEISCLRRGFHYARNSYLALGYGFELGAWRHAVTHMLPTLPLCDDGLLYFLQDSLLLSSPPLPYPPPRGFGAASIFSFRGNISVGGGVSLKNMQGAARAAFANVAGNVSSDVHGFTNFTGCFGPNFVTTWRHARSLRDRGFFEMMPIRHKVTKYPPFSEQVSERVIGLFFYNDETDSSLDSQPPAVCGDYRNGRFGVKGPMGAKLKLLFHKLHVAGHVAGRATG